MEDGDQHPLILRSEQVGITSSDLARRIIAELRSRGHQAWLVGGCVRDLLLGADPKDYDVATGATPEQVLAIWPKAQQVGAHFGVVLITQGGAQVEVATFRSEGPYRDGRRPSHVRFELDPRQDVLRRDFTVNGLLMEPDTFEVLDYVGGRHDIEARVIRAIGDPDKRFREDHLRMLRAVRFAARLGFEIHPETESAIVRLHPLVHDVSAERVRDELVRILTEGSARRGFELLDRTQLLQTVLPEVAQMKGVEQPPEFHPEGDVWTHTLVMLEGLPAGVSPTLALGVLLHDVGKPGTFRVAERIRFDGHVELGVELTRRILTRLRLPNEEIRQVEALVDNHMRFKDAPRMKESTLKRFMRLDHFDEHLELHRLDCTSSHGYLDNYDFVRKKREQLGQEAIRPPRLLGGQDLIDAGFSPGPEFGRVLKVVEDAQLEGRIRTRDEALGLAKEELAITTPRASE
jgi:tRNA nucleotidyltransferase/poly(A) polymerase